MQKVLYLMFLFSAGFVELAFCAAARESKKVTFSREEIYYFDYDAQEEKDKRDHYASILAEIARVADLERAESAQKEKANERQFRLIPMLYRGGVGADVLFLGERAKVLKEIRRWPRLKRQKALASFKEQHGNIVVEDRDWVTPEIEAIIDDPDLLHTINGIALEFEYAQADFEQYGDPQALQEFRRADLKKKCAERELKRRRALLLAAIVADAEQKD